VQLVDNYLVTASSDKTLRVWEISFGNCLKVLIGHTNWVRWVIRVAEYTVASCSHDKTIRLWDINSDKCLKVLEGHTAEVYKIALLAKGFIASVGFDKTVRIWDLEAGAQVRIWDVEQNLYSVCVGQENCLLTGDEEGKI